MTGTPPLPLALTMGDPAGIGPEIAEKAWRELRSDSDYVFFVVADPNLYSDAIVIHNPAEAYDVFATGLPVLALDSPKAILGTPNPNAGTAITSSIEAAVRYAIEGQAAAIVTNPIAKDVLYSSGFEFPGHTEYLAHLTRGQPVPYDRGPIMLLSAAGLRVALATIHLPLAKVPQTISPDLIANAAMVLHGAMTIDFGISKPRIALAGLNPHAGENGALGREELDILNPAVENLRAQGINISKARSADTLFHTEAREGYDVVLAMYHDQGLIPVKTLDFHGGINTTLGLPIIRTSPDHGTAFDIAGRGIARADSLINAICAARTLSIQRAKAT